MEIDNENKLLIKHIQQEIEGYILNYYSIESYVLNLIKQEKFN